MSSLGGGGSKERETKIWKRRLYSSLHLYLSSFPNFSLPPPLCLPVSPCVTYHASDRLQSASECIPHRITSPSDPINCSVPSGMTTPTIFSLCSISLFLVDIVLWLPQTACLYLSSILLFLCNFLSYLYLLFFTSIHSYLYLMSSTIFSISPPPRKKLTLHFLVYFVVRKTPNTHTHTPIRYLSFSPSLLSYLLSMYLNLYNPFSFSLLFSS